MNGAVNQSPVISAKSIITVSLLSIAYLLLSTWVVGFKSDQVVLVVIFNSLFYISDISRKFIIGFSVFIVYWIIFDYMKAIPNYTISNVHIADLYNFEKHLFGINYKGHLLTPNEYLKVNATTFLDVIAGIFYICWIPVPLSFAAYLFFKNRREFLSFALTFLLVNLLGFVIYYSFPAAPPWYIQEHGFIFHPNTPGNTGGLARFDAYFNVHVFQSIYQKGSNVFAAMPSLHSAYPVIVIYYGLKNRLGLINIVLVTVMVGIWLTAVYTSHHYILDVLAGITTAVIGINLFNFLFTKVPVLTEFLDKYEAFIR
ncbi:inositol phosphorylceramide synthase [Mucilaginibacter corticis]|uniref:Inositol phosphorylceramide synthase n=1 Tax=Mucilaginibacter corticis TaxID=2597670 RepID=A0A556MHJ2_9SPHI|nr:phosphatase PAP2 family protein [Mucilaginibacter corticis]TSJ39312.1 inositol phosphorylceramide synthase [Mucilaginibacter corticis]